MDVDGVLIDCAVPIVSIETYRLNMVTAGVPFNMPTERFCVDNGVSSLVLGRSYRLSIGGRSQCHFPVTIVHTRAVSPVHLTFVELNKLLLCCDGFMLR